MERDRTTISRRRAKFAANCPFAGLFFLLVCCVSLLLIYPAVVAAQDASAVVPATFSRFRIGEKLSFNISFGKFRNAGNAEIFVVSQGKIGTTEAVEIRSRVKTVDLVSAAFVLLDESRTVYASPETGLPVYVSKISHTGPIPKESVENYLTIPNSDFDIVTLIYKARENGGAGSYRLFENDQLYTATFQNAGAERVKTEIGEFDTTVSTMQSEWLTANGIKDFKINFAADEHRVPLMIRFKTAKGEFSAAISAIYLPEPEPPVPTPTPTPIPTPVPATTRKPTPTPEAYIENAPLSAELGFQLGETLDYRITTVGKPVGMITLNARERKLFEKVDSLLLTATITGVEQGNGIINLGDAAKAQVDPNTLTPIWTESKFVSAAVGPKQTVTFDKRTGAISFGGPRPIDGPIGTHSIVSLLYAIRSFNLKPSKDPTNPVNDTRVAVFWDSKPHIFTLRPSNPEVIMINGEKVSAQLISINTGNPQLDALSPKVWLSTEERVPVRFSVGGFQAELISQKSNLSK